ncbi:MAG: M20/M25/M40 family metallo-hydrolase [Gemmatimonadetes bacterium]|nr:M20/M25/M40 family metallo-hydrolase [Gemmatimonadota bacterium]
MITRLLRDFRRAMPAALGLLFLLACGRTPGATAQDAPRPGVLPALDSARLIGDVYRLAHDSMGGRGAMTPENVKARGWLEAEFRRLGLEPVDGRHVHAWVRPPRRNATDSLRGANVLGLVRGRRAPERVIVVSAHYDHVGTRNGQVFNGADDNASGTAAVLAMAAHFRAHPPEHTILFALWDAEEVGLQGARAFVAAPPVPLASIVANVNLDMVSRNEKGELFAAGATPWPRMRPLLEALAPQALVTLRLGHDSGGGSEDWTGQSDQGAFHAAGIPFVYFGVEDHPDYHKATDDPERIQPGFYYRAARTIAAFVERLDAAVTSWPPR